MQGERGNEMDEFYRIDKQIMKRCIWKCIYPDEVTVVLADGGDGPVLAHLTPLGDDPRVGVDVELRTNLPEYVTLREVYDHYRAQDMTHAEWKRNTMNELAAMRYRDLPAELGPLVALVGQFAAKHSGISPPCPAPKGPRIVVDEAAETIEVDGIRFAGIEYCDCLIVKELVKARGNWVSAADMHQSEPRLREYGRIDRRINKHIKRDHRVIGNLIETSGKGSRIKPFMF
jgi:hypothetical protein